MNEKMIQVKILGKNREYPYGTPYAAIVQEYEGSTRYPIVLVRKNGKLCELHKKLKRTGSWNSSPSETRSDIRLIKGVHPCSF